MMRKPIIASTWLSLLFAVVDSRKFSSPVFDARVGNYNQLQLQSIIASCVLCAYCCSICIKIVSTGDECLVERLGKYNRSLKPGLNLILPFIEKISFQDTLREQVLDVPPQECFTLDNAPLTADAIVYMKIFNMKDACYEVSNVKNAILNLCLTNVREEVGRLTLEESFSSRGSLSRRLVNTLNAVCHKWGVEVTRVEIQRLEPSQEILRSMELQMSAERKKRAAILQSEGEKTRLVNEAEGRAQALLTDAEARKKSIILASQAEKERLQTEAQGIQFAIQKVASAISESGDHKSSNGIMTEKATKEALQFLSLIRYLEAQAKFATLDGTRVLMFPTLNSLIGTNKQL